MFSDRRSVCSFLDCCCCYCRCCCSRMQQLLLLLGMYVFFCLRGRAGSLRVPANITMPCVAVVCTKTTKKVPQTSLTTRPWWSNVRQEVSQRGSFRRRRGCDAPYMQEGLRAELSTTTTTISCWSVSHYYLLCFYLLWSLTLRCGKGTERKLATWWHRRLVVACRKIRAQSDRTIARRSLFWGICATNVFFKYEACDFFSCTRNTMQCLVFCLINVFNYVNTKKNSYVRSAVVYMCWCARNIKSLGTTDYGVQYYFLFTFSGLHCLKENIICQQQQQQ